MSNGMDSKTNCCDVTYQQAIDNPSIRSYVLEKTKNNFCACDIKNPSGRCCLKSFNKGKL